LNVRRANGWRGGGSRCFDRTLGQVPTAALLGLEKAVAKKAFIRTLQVPTT